MGRCAIWKHWHQHRQGRIELTSIPPALSEHAIPLWASFVEATNAKTVNRLAVRVINKLQLPERLPLDPSVYSNLYVNLPDKLSKTAETFYVQLQLPIDQMIANGRSIINFAGGQHVSNQLELIMDFDLFVVRSIDVNSNELWPLMDKLSEAKNTVFESCITDATRELIS